MRSGASARGFTLVELMVVVFIIGVLAAIAMPVMANARNTAQRKTCFANQRSLEGACQIFAASHDTSLTPYAGVVTAGNPIMENFNSPPRCPSAQQPANPSAPTPAEGAYTIDSWGRIVLDCTFGDPQHGHY